MPQAGLEGRSCRAAMEDGLKPGLQTGRPAGPAVGRCQGCCRYSGPPVRRAAGTQGRPRTGPMEHVAAGTRGRPRADLLNWRSGLLRAVLLTQRSGGRSLENIPRFGLWKHPRTQRRSRPSDRHSGDRLITRRSRGTRGKRGGLLRSRPDPLPLVLRCAGPGRQRPSSRHQHHKPGPSEGDSAPL